jgi:hypothetical protein
MTVYYSAGRNAFYDSALKEHYETSIEGWPVDAKKLTDIRYQELIDGQAEGKIIKPGSAGQPTLADPEIDHVAVAGLSQKALLTAAAEKISLLQDAVDLEMATSSEAAYLKNWRVYRVLLSRIDTSTAPDIEWPATPGVE